MHYLNCEHGFVAGFRAGTDRLVFVPDVRQAMSFSSWEDADTFAKDNPVFRRTHYAILESNTVTRYQSAIERMFDMSVGYESGTHIYYTVPHQLDLFDIGVFLGKQSYVIVEQIEDETHCSFLARNIVTGNSVCFHLNRKQWGK